MAFAARGCLRCRIAYTSRQCHGMVFIWFGPGSLIQSITIKIFLTAMPALIKVV